jgi:hypothetical protein
LVSFTDDFTRLEHEFSELCDSGELDYMPVKLKSIIAEMIMILGEQDKRMPAGTVAGGILIGFKIEELLHHMEQQKRVIWALDNCEYFEENNRSFHPRNEKDERQNMVWVNANLELWIKDLKEILKQVTESDIK